MQLALQRISVVLHFVVLDTIHITFLQKDHDFMHADGAHNKFTPGDLFRVRL